MIEISDFNLKQVRSWMRAGRGVALWESADLCNPFATWLTPGDVTTPPSWRAKRTPSDVVYSAKDVSVIQYGKPTFVRNLSLRVGASGTRIKLTDASRRRVDNAINRVRQKTGSEPTCVVGTDELGRPMATIYPIAAEVRLSDLPEESDES
jgi:hypothetical protein